MEGKEKNGGFGLFFGFFVVAILSDLAASAIKGCYGKFKKSQITDTDKLPATTDETTKTDKVVSSFECIEVPDSIKSTWAKIKGLENDAKRKVFVKFAEAKIKKAV